MICSNLSDYQRACGPVTGGISEIMVFDPSDFNFQQPTSKAPYTSIERRPGATASGGASMFPIRFQDDEGERTSRQSLNGSSSKFEHEVKAQLPQLSHELTVFLQSLTEAGVCCGLALAIRHNDGRIFIMGEKYVNNTTLPKFVVKMNGTEANSGKKMDDFNGANVVFKADFSRELYEFRGGWDAILALAPGATGGDPSPLTFQYYFGSGTIPESLTDIQAGTGGTAAIGSNVSIDYMAITTPSYLWYAEPATEPTKTIWYVDSLNNGSIGNAPELFSIHGTPDGYRVYATNFQTTQEDAPILLRVS